jgi:deoxyinosine 3'endonuclease (endonuclease V)
MAPSSLREEWAAEQEKLSKLSITRDELDWCVHGQFIHGLQHVASVDVSFFPDRLHAVAAVVVLTYPDMKVVYECLATFRLAVPYMAGFLAFREVPALKVMLDKVPSKFKPQVVLVDGNGVFHPRRCGSATHLGILTGLPTVGVAKDILQVGDVNAKVARIVADQLDKASDWAPLKGKSSDGQEPLAVLLRPSDAKRLLVVSAGHKISLNSAAVLTASLCKSSMPEPIRQADLRSRPAVWEWFDGVSLAKLKLGAGDLLEIDVPDLHAVDDAEPDAKRARHTRIDQEGRNQDKSSHRKKKGPLKESLVWRVKASPQECDAKAKIGSVVKEIVACEETAFESDARICNSTLPDSLLVDNWFLDDDVSSSSEVVHHSSSFWGFLTSSLCGLCVVRT